jgi:hypothetical protein
MGIAGVHDDSGTTAFLRTLSRLLASEQRYGGGSRRSFDATEESSERGHGSGSAAARALGACLATLSPTFLNLVASAPTSENGMRDIINASLQTGNPVINSILHTPPTRQQLNAYPFLAKINASAQLLGETVAEALMAKAGARSLGTKPTLVRALTPHTLCELLVGNSIPLATLVNISCAYRRAILLHAHFEQLSLSAMAGNLTWGLMDSPPP